MKTSNESMRLFLGVLACSTFVSILGCGGSEQEPTTTVAKQVPYQAAGVDSNGNSIIYDHPAPGTAQKQVDALAAAGVKIAKRKQCGARVFLDGNGELITVGLSPNFVVLVEVSTRDIEIAKQLGFVEGTSAYLKSVVNVADCESFGI